MVGAVLQADPSESNYCINVRRVALGSMDVLIPQLVGIIGQAKAEERKVLNEERKATRRALNEAKAKVPRFPSSGPSNICHQIPPQ